MSLKEEKAQIDLSAEEEKYGLDWVFDKYKESDTIANNEEAENFFWKYHANDSKEDIVQTEETEEQNNVTSTPKEEPEALETFNTETTQSTKEEITVNKIEEVQPVNQKEPANIPEALLNHEDKKIKSKSKINTKFNIWHLISCIAVSISVITSCIALYFRHEQKTNPLYQNHIIAKPINTNDMLLLNTEHSTSSMNRIIEQGYDDPTVISIMRQIIKPQQVVVDAGSGHGYYSTYMSRIVGKEGIVHSIEGNAHTANLLAKSIRMNGISNIKLYNKVLYSNNTNVTLTPGKGQINISDASNSIDGINSQPSSTLDEILNSVNNVAFININANGNEANIILGSTHLMKRSNNNIKILATWSTRSLSNSNQSNFFHKIKSLGFNLWHLNMNRKIISIKSHTELSTVKNGHVIIARSLK